VWTLKTGEIMVCDEMYNTDLDVFVRADAFDTIDCIANELLTIEESARMTIGIITPGDQLLIEINMPNVSDLVHLPQQHIWAYPY
jgi:hypothetical protein